MDSKIAVMFALVVLAVMISTSSAGKHKKVIIHVPYKVKNIKHTHTVYKTIHHHHGHGGGHGGHGGHGHKSHGGHSHGHGHEEIEDHEHFHHHGDHHGFHSMPVAQYVLPDMSQIPMPVPLPVHYFNQRR